MEGRGRRGREGREGEVCPHSRWGLWIRQWRREGKEGRRAKIWAGVGASRHFPLSTVVAVSFITS